jgi:hypothetical protein
MTKNTLFWILRITAALIMLQSLFFKFTAAPESVALFEQLGLEPWGRLGIGVAELVASLMLLFPKTVGNGAVLGLVLMVGALGAHLTNLGFAGDMGLLAGMAGITAVCCLAVALRFRHRVFCIICWSMKKLRR